MPDARDPSIAFPPPGLRADPFARPAAHGDAVAGGATTVPAALVSATRAIGELMSSGDDPGVVIDGMLAVLKSVCDADVAAVNRVRDETLTILHAAADQSETVVGRPYPLSETICRFTWSDSGVVVLEQGDPALAVAGTAHDPATPAAMSGPSQLAGYAGRTLIIDGRRWGTVAVWSSRPLAVSRDEAGLLVEMTASAVVAQLARARTRLLFREVESTAGIGAWSLSLTSGVLWWSDEVFHIHGYANGAFQPTVDRAIDFYHPEDRSTIRMLVEHCIIAGDPWDVRLRLITATGETRWVRARGQRIADAGVPARIVGTFEDVHEQVLGELERDTIRSRLEHAIHGTDDGLWDWPDMDRDEQWWSPRFLQLVGRAAGEVPPRQSAFLELVHPDEREEVGRAMATSRADGRPFEMEFRVVPPNGPSRWVLGRARVTTGGRGRGGRMAGSIQDIDERRRMESLLRTRTREIETFLHAASHDLKSPMLTIDAFSEQIQTNAAEGSRETLVHAAGRVRAATGRMHAIVRDLLAYGRTGRTEPSMRRIEMAPLVAELRNQLAGAFDRRTVRIETDFAVPAVVADRGQMSSVLQNLLTNAIEHGLREDGRSLITVRTCAVPAPAGEAPSLVRLLVGDEGPGIPADERERIFLPFERLRSSGGGTTGIGGGTGLGLAIVRQVAEAWGGRAVVEDDPAGGARFVVEWPGLMPEDAGTNASAAAEAAQS